MVSKAWQIVQDYHIKAVQDKFKCIKCHNLLTQAMQTPCGCFICEECANQHFNVTVGRPCPGATLDCDSNIIFKQNRPDNAKRREIAQLQIDCPIGKEVCGKLQMTGMVDHVANCPCRIIPCAASCGAELQHRHYEKHKEACPKRMMVCENCFEAMPKSQYELQHLSRRAPKCRKYEFACPFCDLRGPFTSATLPQHSGVCPNWEIQCDFEECPEPFYKPARALEHADQYRVAHLKQLAAAARSIQRDAKKMHSLTQKLELDYISGDNHLLEYKNVKEAAQTCIQQLCCHNASGTMTQKMLAMEWQEKCTDLREQLYSVTGFVWIIDQINERKQRGEKFVDSPTFYSSKLPSYKLGLRIYWNFSEPTTQISVAFRLVVGKYDRILQWPFPHNLKVTLHTVNTPSKEEFLSPSTDNWRRNPSCGGSDPGFAIGCAKFMLKKGCVLDDALFLSCKIV